MRSHVATALVVTALGALVACSSSSSGSPSQPADAGGCTDTLANVLAASPIGCPVDANGAPVSYDEAITQTCDTEKLKTGDIQYGQCFQYLVFAVDEDSTGNNFTRCFYDVGTHALVGVLYSDGKGMDQCGGTSASIAGGSADPSCTISGLHGGGAGYQACAPVSDAGTTPVNDAGGSGG